MLKRHLHTVLHITGWLLLLALDGYCLGALGFLGLRALTGDRYWPLALAGNFTPWLLIPSFAVLAIMLWRRRKVSVALAGAVALGFVWQYGVLFAPGLPRGCPDCQSLRVMTYNIWVLNDSDSAFLDALAGSGADLIGLQEVSGQRARLLQDHLNDAYPYQVVDATGGNYGLALLSRYPVGDHGIIWLTPQGPPALWAEIDAGGQTITALVIHMPVPHIQRWGYTIRSEEAVRALALLVDPARVTLVLGDFNTTDRSDTYRVMAGTGLIDSFREAGWGLGLTWPDERIRPDFPHPLIRIDYIWHSPHFHAQRAWVGPDGGSDHLPVLADLQLGREQPVSVGER